ncbi:MAG: DsbA family protein [Candidatus Methylomirabilales bacterium]
MGHRRCGGCVEHLRAVRCKGYAWKSWHLVLLCSLGAVLASTSSAVAQPLKAEEVLALLAKGPAKGSEGAPVTIIEFSDFQCTFCWRFWKQTLPRLEEEYIKPGKVRFVYRHLAILGPQSVAAAQASECAQEQGRFWEYHDELFASKGFSSLAERRLKQYARDLGLDGAAFDLCLDAGKYAEKVEGETGIGLALGARGTPTFFINGLKLVGAHPFQTFRSIIEEELKSIP